MIKLSSAAICIKEVRMVSISVVMPTYNTAIDVLREAVDSILQQTFQDFEFIIIDDGSTNDSIDYLQNLKDKRIRLIRNPENLGITRSLNIGLRAAKGKYIARMDSDDIAVPVRFEKQFSFMEKHPAAIACGSNVEYFGAYSGVSDNRTGDMETYRIRALFVNPGPMHPTAFMRRELLLKYQIFYDEQLTYSQDYGLWSEICEHGQVYILKDALLRYRIHDYQISIAHRETQIRCDYIVLKKLLGRLLGEVTEKEIELHCRYGTGYYWDAEINDEILNWLDRLEKANDRLGIYDRRKLKRFIDDTVLKRAVYRSFSDDMSYVSRALMFFKYLRFPYSLKAAAGMSIRRMIRGKDHRKYYQ